MTDAETTIRHSILMGLTDMVGGFNSHKKAEIIVDLVMDRLFEKQVRWSIGQYLVELYEEDKDEHPCKSQNSE